ncbi:MAG: hypothetical protein O7G83_18555 [Proteobacteria bacterium]|nr:hypothetical protein [Pseudomonadota bacterium]
MFSSQTPQLIFMFGSRNLRLAPIIIASVVGCTSVQVRYPDGSTEYKTTDEFAIYVEEVFRYHNGVVNALITATAFMDAVELDEDSPLVLAEETMANACWPLNDAVSATIEGRELGFFHKMMLLEAVPACERASQHVQALLPPPA